MSEFKGTLGDWEWSHRPIPLNEDGMYSTQVYCKEGKTICSVDWYPCPREKGLHNGKPVFITKTYREANAQLISKAPEMLEILESIVRLEDIICLGGTIGEQWIGEAETLAIMMGNIKQLIKEATTI